MAMRHEITCVIRWAIKGVPELPRAFRIEMRPERVRYRDETETGNWYDCWFVVVAVIHSKHNASQLYQCNT